MATCAGFLAIHFCDIEVLHFILVRLVGEQTIPNTSQVQDPQTGSRILVGIVVGLALSALTVWLGAFVFFSLYYAVRDMCRASDLAPWLPALGGAMITWIAAVESLSQGGAVPGLDATCERVITLGGPVTFSVLALIDLVTMPVRDPPWAVGEIDIEAWLRGR